YQQITDAAFGQVVWVVSGRVNVVEASIKAENDLLMKKETSVHRWHHMRDASLRFVVGFFIILMMYWTNFQLEYENNTATIITTFVLMMFYVTDALLQVSDAVEEIPMYLDSITRME